MGPFVSILLSVLSSLLTKKVVASILASVIEWAVKSSKTPVDDEVAKPILEKLRSL